MVARYHPSSDTLARPRRTFRLPFGQVRAPGFRIRRETRGGNPTPRVKNSGVPGRKSAYHQRDTTPPGRVLARIALLAVPKVHPVDPRAEERRLVSHLRTV